MSGSLRGTAAGLAAGALAALLVGTAIAPASADSYTDQSAVCAGGAADVCAHIQTSGTQLRAEGTAADGQGVTIVSVELDLSVTGYPGGVTTSEIASSSSVTDSGGQLSCVTTSTTWLYSYKSTNKYIADVTYRINGGTEQTVTANYTAPPLA